MRIEPLEVLDSFLLVPDPLDDARGSFFESYKPDQLEQYGHGFRPAQVNVSTSKRDVVRGLHGVLLPPGQAKVVSCPRGAIRDVVVDLRPGSPGFGTWVVNELSAANGRSVYVAEGLTHGFVALGDDTAVTYLCSTAHVPGTQVDIDPFDRQLDIPWDCAGEALVSPKDAQAPDVAEAAARGLLAPYAQCVEHYRELAGRRARARTAESAGTDAEAAAATDVGGVVDTPGPGRAA